jgi:hypothetical protein
MNFIVSSSPFQIHSAYCIKPPTLAATLSHNYQQNHWPLPPAGRQPGISHTRASKFLCFNTRDAGLQIFSRTRGSRRRYLPIERGRIGTLFDAAMSISPRHRATLKESRHIERA